MDFFEYKPVPREHYPQLESLYDFTGYYTLFDDFADAFNRPMSQQEYLLTGVGCAEKFFKEKPTQYIYRTRGLHTFEWTKRLERAVKHRLDRTYVSFLIEEQVKDYLKRKKYTFYASNLLDISGGVDIAVQDEDRLYYIHVAKNSSSSKNMLKKKGSMKSYKKVNNKKIYFQRNWLAGHHSLLYNTTDSDRMQYINGNLIFNEDYLDIYFNKLLQSDNYDVFNGQSELEQFNEFATQCGEPLELIKEND